MNWKTFDTVLAGWVAYAVAGASVAILTGQGTLFDPILFVTLLLFGEAYTAAAKTNDRLIMALSAVGPIAFWVLGQNHDSWQLGSAVSGTALLVAAGCLGGLAAWEWDRERA